MVITATETRLHPWTSSATWLSTRPVPLPHPPLKYRAHPASGTRPMRNGRLPAGRTGHGEGFHRPPRCLSYGILPDQRGPDRPDADLGRVQLATDRAEMGAELIPVLLQPLLLQLRGPPGELERIPLEQIELTLGFR